MASAKNGRSSTHKSKIVVVPGDPPDGGFGWVVVLMGFLQHVLILGLAYTIGVYYPTFKDPEDLAGDTTTVAWIGTAHLCMLFASGPLAGYLLNKTTTLFVGFVGSLTAGIGCIVAAFSPNIYLVIIFFGFVSGTGTGLMFMSAVTAVSRWFSKKRSIATGLCVSGAGFGVFAFSPLIRLMIGEWGRKEALLIEGALAFHGCIFSLLLRPVPPNPRKNSVVKNEERVEKGNLPIIYHGPKKGNVTDGLKEEHQMEEMQPLQENGEKKIEPSSTAGSSSISRQITTTHQMWRDINFWLFILSQVFTFFGASAPLVYLYSRAELDCGIEPMQASFIVSIMGIFNTFGRVAFGVLGNVVPKFRFYLLALSIVTFGAATVACTWGTSYISIAVYAAVFGSGYGGMFALTSVILVDLFGLKLFQTIYGSIGFFRGAAIISAPPVYGWLIQVAGGQHSILFVITGILGVIAGSLLLLIPISDRIRSFRSRPNK